MPSPRVLVVESDPSTLGLLTHGMNRLGLTAEGASGLDQALASLAQERPDIVVSEVEGGAGLRVLEELRQNPRTRDVPMVLLARGPWARRRAHLRELGAQELVAKPAFVQDVAVLAWLYAGRAASSEDWFEGTFGEPSCAALLRSLLAGGRTGSLRLEPSGGLVRFREGTVVEARLPPLEGERALLRILTLETGNYELSFEQVDSPTTMKFELSDLTDRGLVYVRDWQTVRTQLEPLEQVLMLDFEAVSQQLNELPGGLWGLLRLFDGKRSLLSVITDSPLDDLTAGRAIVKLRKLGMFERGARIGWDGTTPSLRHREGGPLPAELAAVLADSAASASAARRAVVDVRLQAPSEQALQTALPDSEAQAPFSPEDEEPFFSAARAPPAVVASGEPNAALVLEALEARGLQVASAQTAAAQAMAELERAFYESPVEAHHWHEALAPAEARRPSAAPSALRSMGWALALFAGVGLVAILWRGTPGGASSGLSAAAPAAVSPARPVRSATVSRAPVVAPPRAAPAAVLDTMTVPGASTATGNEVKALLEKGGKDYDHGKLALALASYDRARVLAPSDPSVQLARGLTLYDLGRLDAAAAALVDASKLDPKNARPELMLGAISQERGDRPAAKQHYERYLSLEPKGQHAAEVRKLLSTLGEE